MNRITKQVAWSYFAVHALVELVCFALLYNRFGFGMSFIIAMTFDFFAFVPQALIGQLNNTYRKMDIATMGVILMTIAVIILGKHSLLPTLAGVIILAVGNAMLHEAGAIATVVVSEGRLFPSALFVAGGSFGLITGQVLGKMGINRFFLLIALVLIEILVLFTNKYWHKENVSYPRFNLVNRARNEWIIIAVAFFVTTARSFVGYAIPISWNKAVWQAFVLFFVMGTGKAAGGWLTDRFGARRVGVISTLGCIPFLLIGKDLMLISIMGVFLFSITMSITFGMLLSVIEDNPGLAFGITTIGLFIGICPVLLCGSFGYIINIILVVALSVLSAGGLYITLKEV